MKSLFDQKHADMIHEYMQFCKIEGRQILATEVPYNHYGERGWADLITYNPKTEELCVIEIKPEIVNIGETTRQVQKMANTFLLDPRNNKYKAYAKIRHIVLIYENAENLIRFQNYYDQFSVIMDHVLWWSPQTGERKEKHS
jgi:hypothetical protein